VLSCGQQSARHSSLTPLSLHQLVLTGTVGGVSAIDDEPLRRCV
jgi:hypothetical protein